MHCSSISVSKRCLVQEPGASGIYIRGYTPGYLGAASPEQVMTADLDPYSLVAFRRAIFKTGQVVRAVKYLYAALLA